MWPGFGDNARVLKWIFERTNNSIAGKSTPIGFVPKKEDLDLSGLQISQSDVDELFHIDLSAWKKEAEELKQYFQQFGEHLPSQIADQIQNLERRLSDSQTT